MAKEIELTIDGEGVSPETVQWRDLQEVVNGIHRAVLSTAVDAGISKGEVVFSLADIKDGSDLLTICTDDRSHRSSQRIINALNTRDDSGITHEARQGLEQAWKRLDKLEWGLLFSLNGSRQSRAWIRPKEPIFDPPEGLLHGKTSLLVEVIHVGGESPTAKLLTSDGQRFTAQIASRPLASLLGQRLYKTVQLEADVTWDTAAGTIYGARITGIGPYDLDNADPVQALESIRVLTEGYWDTVEPSAAIEEQRSE